MSYKDLVENEIVNGHGQNLVCLELQLNEVVMYCNAKMAQVTL